MKDENRLSRILEATKGLGFWGRLDLLTDALAVIVRANGVKRSSEAGSYVRHKLAISLAQTMRKFERRFPDEPEATEERPKLLH